MARDYSFRFVCQGGALAQKAAFLAASLHHNLRCDHELVACVPEGEGMQAPAAEVLAFLASIGVRCEPVGNPLADDYLIGHKLACLALVSDCGQRVFLDSDILCLKPFYGFPEAGQGAVQAKLEDWNHHADAEWEMLYRRLQLGPPQMTYRSTVLDQPMPLYCNAGVIALAGESGLAEQWIALAREIDGFTELPRRRPNLDQLALAALLVRERTPLSLLGEDYNFPAELRPLDHLDIPWFCHYHDPVYILADDYLSSFVSALCQRYPALRDIARRLDHWAWSHVARQPRGPVHA